MACLRHRYAAGPKPAPRAIHRERAAKDCCRANGEGERINPAACSADGTPESAARTSGSGRVGGTPARPPALMTVRRMRKLHHGGCLILTNQESLPVSPGDLFAKSSTLSLISDTGPNKYGYNWALLAFVQALAHSTLA